MNVLGLFLVLTSLVMTLYTFSTIHIAIIFEYFTKSYFFQEAERYFRDVHISLL